MKKRLMVVDDSRVLEYQICKLLEDTDYEVAAYCENGEEAIARYEEVRPDIVTTGWRPPRLLRRPTRTRGLS